MKVIASFLSLTLVAVLSAWLWLGQNDPTDIETAGVQIDATDSAGQPQDGSTSSGGAATPQDRMFTDDQAAAFVGLQAVLDVWQNQTPEVLADPEALNKLLADARTAAETEVAAVEQQAKEKAEEAAAKKKAEEEAAAKKKAKEQAPPPKAVSPPPVAPQPPPGCEWDDDEWDCDDDDDDWDDDDDDWDDDDDDDDWDDD